MKIIVIGATGTIGSKVIEQLRARHEVIAVGSSSGDYQADIASVDAVRALFERLGQEWEGYSATAEAFHDAGDTIVVTGWYAGTYRKSGKSFRARFAHVWRLRDGKIHRFEQFTDTLLVARAMAGDGPGGR